MRAIFTNSEIEFIKKNYATMTNKEIGTILNKTPDQIKNRGHALGLKSNPKISEYQKSYIKENYSKMKNPEIAKELNMSIDSIQNYAARTGLKKELYGRGIWTKSEEEFLKNNYNKMPKSEISKVLGKTESQIQTKSDNMKIVQNDYTYANIKGRTINKMTSLNVNYFKKIDTEEKAYWLGFLYADGYVYNRKSTGEKRLELGLKYDDYDHIFKFKEAVSAPQNIKKKIIKNKKYNKEYESAKLAISNKVFVSNLEKKGCYQNKSLTLKFPNNEIVPYKLIRHFIRGYFDGDGCLLSRGNVHIANFVGTKDVLDNIQKILHNELYFNFTKITKKGNAYQMTYGGINNFMRFCNYIYDDSSIFLDRKFEIYKNTFINNKIA